MGWFVVNNIQVTKQMFWLKIKRKISGPPLQAACRDRGRATNGDLHSIRLNFPKSYIKLHYWIKYGLFLQSWQIRFQPPGGADTNLGFLDPLQFHTMVWRHGRASPLASPHSPHANQRPQGPCAHAWTSSPPPTLATLQAKATGPTQDPEQGGKQGEGLRWTHPPGPSAPASCGEVWLEWSPVIHRSQSRARSPELKTIHTG